MRKKCYFIDFIFIECRRNVFVELMFFNFLFQYNYVYTANYYHNNCNVKIFEFLL